MTQNIDFKNKYLKYKSKFFNLKKSIGGSVAKPEGSPKTTAPKSGSPKTTVAKPEGSTKNNLGLEIENYSWTSGNFIPEPDHWLDYDPDLGQKNRLIVRTFNFKLKDGTEKSRFGFRWWNDVREKSIKSIKSGITNKSSKEVIDSLYKEFIGKIFDIKDVDTKAYRTFLGKTIPAGEYIRSINLFTIDVGKDKEKKIHFRLDFGLPKKKDELQGFPYDLGFEPNKSGGIGKRTSDFVNFSCRWVREGLEKDEELSELYFDFKTGYDTKEKKFIFKTVALDVPEFDNYKDKFAEKFSEYMNSLLRRYVKFIHTINDTDPDNNIEAFLEQFHKLWEKSRDFYYNIRNSYKDKKNMKRMQKQKRR